MKVLVGSKNPVKINAVKQAFSRFFNDVEVVGISVPSNVPSQPVNDQTFNGARNRVLGLKRINDEKGLGAKFFVGIEGGIMQHYSRWFAFGGICIMDNEGREGYGTSPHFELPEVITRELLKGIELGDVMDKIQKESNTKQKHGAIGFLTGGVTDRTKFYVEGLTVALCPFLNKEMYFEDSA